MCSIAGFFNCETTNEQGSRSVCLDILNKMNRKLKRRGPDDSGVYLNNGCALAHNRLSIIDIKKGNQPMSSNDGEFTIVYNGEIYNMNSIKEDLIKKGALFRTDSDTEVILNGFAREGVSFIKKLNGIFAFAIYKSSAKELVLVRDRLGVKPLFYTVLNNTIVFASEIKGLFEYPGFKPQIDKNGLREIFGLGPAKTYGCGVFKDVYEVLPGTAIKFSKDGLNSYKYWELKAYKHTDNYCETVEKTKYLIKDAVSMQTLSDVPICSFLSGGIDSSLITSIASKQLSLENKSVNTFSFDFKDNNKYFKSNSFQPSQDFPYVKKMVGFLNTNHRCLFCDNTDLINELYDVVKAHDLPGMADIESSMLYFCSKVSEYNKVALTGECADEIFGGYPWFSNPESLNRNAFPWSYDVSPRIRLLKDELIADLDLETYSQDAYKKTIDECPKLDGEDGVEKRRREITYLNIKWFMATLLDRMDRCSMYSGLEARVPYADHRIVEYMFNVPWEFKCKDGVVKGLLREAAKDYLPKEILYRKKSPYPKTYNPVYEKMLGRILLSILEDKTQPINDFLDKNKVVSFLNSPKDYGQPFYGQLMAGPQLLAYMIQVNYLFNVFNVLL